MPPRENPGGVDGSPYAALNYLLFLIKEVPWYILLVYMAIRQRNNERRSYADLALYRNGAPM